MTSHAKKYTNYGLLTSRVYQDGILSKNSQDFSVGFYMKNKIAWRREKSSIPTNSFLLHVRKIVGSPHQYYICLKKVSARRLDLNRFSTLSYAFICLYLTRIMYPPGSPVGLSNFAGQKKKEYRAYERASTFFTRRYLSIAKNGCYCIYPIAVSAMLNGYKQYIHQ